MILHVLILLAVLGALVAPWLARLAGRAGGWWLAVLPAGLAVGLATYLPRIAAGETVRETVAWFPAFDVSLSLWLDGLSLLFALLITALGALIVAYAGGYLKGDAQLPRFYLLILAFMASMLGVVLADNLIVLFVFWELTSLTSYFLIGYKHDEEDSRKSALQALLVTGTGGLAMLAGFVLLGLAGGTLELSLLLAQADALRADPLFAPALILILIGAFTKSAQFPFHFWLPNAMAAPTPVSAYLHSATMVKAGVYLLARLSPLMAAAPLWTPIVTTIGALTVLAAGLLALKQTDLKRLLAYTTVMALGFLTLLLGLATPAAAKAAMVFLLAHALYKGALFMVAGSIDHEAGSRDVSKLGGLRQVMPLTFAAAILAGLSMAGLPPMLGFIGKELLYEAALEFGVVVAAVAVVASVAMLVVTLVVVIKPFFGPFRAPAAHVHEAPPSMLLGPLLLGVAGLVIGLGPGLIETSLAQPAVAAVLGEPYRFALYLFPEAVNAALILSGLTVLLGVAGFALWPWVYTWLERLARFDVGPARVYTWLVSGLLRLATWQTQLIQTGNLRNDLTIVLSTALLLVGGTLLLRELPALHWNWAESVYFEWVLAVLILGAALNVVLTLSRLTAVVSLGVIGFSVALIFLVFSAPDLAITQFLVETLLVVIIAVVMLRLPHIRIGQQTKPSANARNAALAIGAGVVTTALLLAVNGLPFNTEVPAYYLEQSVPQGFGRNVVNVILVDFRALDTLGEIVVLAIAGLGVYALLKAGLRRDS